MEPFKTVNAIAAPIDEPNLDTNQLCPTRFNKLARNDPYYSKVLFNNQRFTPAGEINEDFILNRSPFDQAQIIVGERNWGCGSSRESAVYALAAFGIRVVIAPSFGDIHASNAMKNGLLPVVLPREACDTLRASLHASPGAKLEVNLETQTVIGPNGTRYSFNIQPGRKRTLLLGLDDIDITFEHLSAIESFEARYRPSMPWLY